MIRDFDSENLLEIFLVSAVSAILLIRLFLHLTGYPQIGGGGLHIAHMLWGGLLMLLSIIMILVMINRDKYWLAALLAGLGFGTFVDELGKFITRDNNYFFEPTISLIYVIFILLYLVIRAISHLKAPTQEELLVNSLEIVKQGLAGPLTFERLNRAQSYLSQAVQLQQSDALTATQSLLELVKADVKVENQTAASFKKITQKIYDSLAKTKALNWIVIAVFLVQTGYFLFHSVITTDIIADYLSPSKDSILSFDEIGYVLFSAVSGVLIVIGVIRLFKSRLSGYRLFKIAVLANLFLTSIFDFYTNQFGALLGFFFNMFLLILLNLLISIETEKSYSQPQDDE